MSIQEVLESRLEVMLGTPVSARASGRTDAGVHARGQVVSFEGSTRLQSMDIQRGLNSLLPPDIVVLQADEVPHSFHARFSATSKTYEYLILNRPVPSALEKNYSWHVRRPLNMEPMRECLRAIEGCHDFTSFMATGSSVSSTQRHMFEAELSLPDSCHLRFAFTANGFLRHMVRNIVGTLVEVGKGKRTARDFSCVLAGKDRRLAGMTAPAHGLYLLHVTYETRDIVNPKGRDEP